MSDRRRHRGPHPQDYQLFAPPQWPALASAAADLSWLWSRGYAEPSSVKLVGDRYHLRERQRLAVRRAACSDRALQQRSDRRLSPEQLTGRAVHVDGFNLLTTIEAALARAVLLDCRDGTTRDMASLHGSYRIVEETRPALIQIGEWLATAGAESYHWWLDQPVSNSGRLAALLRETGQEFGWDWEVTLSRQVDRQLIQQGGVAVSSDSVILDECHAWVAASRHIVDRLDSALWRVPLDGHSPGAFPFPNPAATT